MAEVTVVFADLTGSTGVFESLGNAKATKAITRLTQWIGKICSLHEGYVVKNLGDGVLMVFPENMDAVNAVIEMQRLHQERIRDWPEALKMSLQIGLASGEIVEQEGDCFGDAVNLASRLSDLSGPEQILATTNVVEKLGRNRAIRTQCLGAMEIRGRTEACVVHRIEWQSEVKTDFLTVPAAFASPAAGRNLPAWMPSIELSWLDVQASFTQNQLPLSLGRDSGSGFVVEDPRVSRRHAIIEYRAGKFYLEDTSSYGSWVRFSDSTAVLALRRNECVLMGGGEIALGAPFEDFTVPTVSFRFPEPVAALAGGKRQATSRTIGR
jgi:adenylate cyclase